MRSQENKKALFALERDERRILRSNRRPEGRKVEWKAGRKVQRLEGRTECRRRGGRQQEGMKGDKARRMRNGKEI